MSRTIILIAIILSLAVVCAAQFGGGDGTEANPWQIETAEHLDNVRNYLEAHFRQTADINLGVAPWNVGEGWEPIGIRNNAFRGSYDGNGHIIANLTIRRPETFNIGLFGYVSAGNYMDETLIKDLGLNDVYIQGFRRVGAFIGSAEEPGSIKLSGCYVTGTIKGGNFIGAIIGSSSLNITLTVENCYSVAEITSTSPVFSGFVGISSALNSYISKSYISGPVTSKLLHYQPAAFMGAVSALSRFAVEDSYWNINTTDVNPYFRDIMNFEGIGGRGRTYQEMVMRESFENWDFDDIWALEEGETYPYLQWQGEPAAHNYPGILPPSDVKAYISGEGEITLVWQPPELGEPDNYRIYRDGVHIGSVAANTLGFRDEGLEDFVPYRYYVIAESEEEKSFPSRIATVVTVPGVYGGGSGTVEDPYLISNSEHLDYIRHNPHAHYLQTDDIDLVHIENWRPILLERVPMYDGFYGSYDGNGLSISNLNISYNHIPSGLFSSIGRYGDDEIVLKNINLVNVSVTGIEAVGGLTGLINTNGLITIANCHVSGSVMASHGAAGGLVGGALESRAEILRIIRDCSSRGSVEAERSAGGLIGVIHNSQVLNSYSTAVVTGREKIGGLIGEGMFLLVENCYATGDVFGSEWTGGLIGGNLISSEVSNSYSTGRVVDGHGLLRYLRSEITNCYWDIETSGQESSAGGEGRTTEQMTYPYDDETYVDWDFEDVWVEDINRLVNNGYPYLYWQSVPYPDTAQSPKPPNEAVDISLDLEELSWVYIPAVNFGDPSGFRVYFSDSHEFDDDVYEWVDYVEGEENYSCPEILPEFLENITTYYWRVVPTNDIGHALNNPVWSFTTIDPTDVEAINELPVLTKLNRNYPNPFNPETTISFSLAEAGVVVIEIFNNRGQRVVTLADNKYNAGNHQVIWNGRDSNSNTVGNGIYLYRMKTNDYTATGKMILMK